MGAPLARAEFNALIIGSDRNYGGGATFKPAGIYSNFLAMVENDPAIEGPVSVDLAVISSNKIVATRSGSGGSTVNVNYGIYTLLQYFYWPDGREDRWAYLEQDWDCVVMMDDPYVMQSVPAFSALGVGEISRTVRAGGGFPMLLAQGGGAQTAEHVYRIADGADIPVAPYLFAWEALNDERPDLVDTGAAPTTNGAYVAAATIYSRLFNRSATNTTYIPSGLSESNRNVLAGFAHEAVLSDQTNTHYTGPYAQQNPYLFANIKKRSIGFDTTGSSTENYIHKELINIARHAGMVPYWPGGGWVPYVDFMEGRYPGYATDNDDNRDYAFGFGLQHFAGDISMQYGIDTGNQTAESDLANAMALSTLGNEYRGTPLRLLWSMLTRDANHITLNVDNWHMTTYINQAIASFMMTIMTGRYAAGDEPELEQAPPWWLWKARQVGYEAAWRMSTLQNRVPAFQVLPRVNTITNVTPATAETMTVCFYNAPTSTVQVAVAVDDSSAAVVHPPYLLFRPENHAVKQTVTIQGLPGAEATKNIHVTFTPASDDRAFTGFDDTWTWTVERATTQDVAVATGTTNSATVGAGRSYDIGLPASGSTESNTTFIVPAHGAIEWENGQLMYTPADGYEGPDHFAYYVTEHGTVTVYHVALDVIPRVLDVFGNGQWIISGDTTPSADDHTDFGGRAPSTGATTHTFMLTNSGPSVVQLTGSPAVTITGGDGAFTLGADAGATSLSPGAATTFQLDFEPLAPGNCTATVHIANNGGVNEPYVFAVTGVGESAPSVETDPATAIDNTSATLHGALTAGEQADVKIFWGLTGDPLDQVVSLGIRPESSFHSDLTGLQPGTGYSFRAYASNDVGEVWAALTETFTTETAMPQATGAELPDATVDLPYTVDFVEDSLVADADLPSDALTFSSTNPPAWLNLDTGGELTGTPGESDVGPFAMGLDVEDQFGNTTQIVFNATVLGFPGVMLPFADDFEGYLHEESVTGANGWYGAPEQGVALDATYEPHALVDFPFFESPHTRVLFAQNGLRALFKDTDAVRHIWFDGMIQFRPAHPAIQSELDARPEVQLAWMANDDGALTIYHAVLDGVSDYSNRLTSIEGTMLLDGWTRLTAYVSYSNAAHDLTWFQIQLDSADPVHSPYAYNEPGDTVFSPTGTWFLAANPLQAEAKISSIHLLGDGFFDDVAVWTNEPPVLPRGELRVMIEPSSEMGGVAQWRLTDGIDTDWHDSGWTIERLDAGSYTLEFSKVTGWFAPQTRTVDIQEEILTLETGVYYPANAGTFAPEPTLWYDFDEAATGNGTVLDKGTGTPADGVFHGATTRVPGTPNNISLAAMSTEGSHFNSYVQAPTPQKLNAIQAFTLTTWINLRANPGANTRIISLHNSAFGFDWRINNTHASPFSKNNFSMTLKVDQTDATSSTAIQPADGWLFLAVSYDGTQTSENVRFFAGSETSEVAQVGAAMTLNEGPTSSTIVGLRIGSSVGFGGNVPHAWFDEVRLYNRVLTELELKEVRRSGAGLAPPYPIVTVLTEGGGTQWMLGTPGDNDEEYILQATTNILDSAQWIDIKTNTASGVVVDFEPVNAGDYPNRYFRIVKP